MSTTIKKSRQRDAIVAFLKTRKDHPTADVIYANLRETIPNISLGTVYRNLALLSERGEILRLSCDNKIDHFDGFTHPHYHFVCLDCQSVCDIEAKEDFAKEINEKASKCFDGIITSNTILFKGYCKNCKCNHS